jgi:hypothetical protein
MVKVSAEKAVHANENRLVLVMQYDEKTTSRITVSPSPPQVLAPLSKVTPFTVS